MRVALAGIVVAGAFAALPGTGAGQTTPPPCPAGTKMATVAGGTTDNEIYGNHPDQVVATHSTELDEQLDYSSGAAISPNQKLVLTPPDGLSTTPVDRGGDASEAGLTFTPPAPATYVFTATWTQYDSYDSRKDCSGSTQIPVTVVPDIPMKISHVFGALQHWAGKPGSPLNVLSVGWTLVTDDYRGDATPVLLTVRAANGRRLPTASAPAATMTWRPYRMTYAGINAHNALVRLRAASLGQHGDAHNNFYEDAAVNVSVLVYPPGGRGTTHRAFVVDLTQGSRTLAHYQLVTACRLARSTGLRCKPMPHGGT